MDAITSGMLPQMSRRPSPTASTAKLMNAEGMNFAVDGDGDGRRDIWGSMPDVIASTANYLARSGWQTGQAWGAEVQLPQGFDFARADPSVRQSGMQWEAEGLRSVDGRPLPALTDATVFLPATRCASRLTASA